MQLKTGIEREGREEWRKLAGCWPAPPPPSTHFATDVWRRIADEESAGGVPFAFFLGLGPGLKAAAAFLLLAGIVAGAGIAHVQNAPAPGASAVSGEMRYLESIDPLRMAAAHGMEER